MRNPGEDTIDNDGFDIQNMQENISVNGVDMTSVVEHNDIHEYALDGKVNEFSYGNDITSIMIGAKNVVRDNYSYNAEENRLYVVDREIANKYYDEK